MSGMIDSIHAKIELAARQGESQARISLEPAELGEIRIHLTQTSSGLLARLTANTPAAAQALAAGRSELHQALSSLGTTLLRLDIGSSGPSEGHQGRQEDAPAGASQRSGSTDGEETIETTTGPDGAQPAGPQALGELVDVLA
jgi:type III secretion system needle length determinant